MIATLYICPSARRFRCVCMHVYIQLRLVVVRKLAYYYIVVPAVIDREKSSRARAALADCIARADGVLLRRRRATSCAGPAAIA